MDKKAKKNVWSSDYKPYGTYKGERGNPDQWKDAYEQRMGSNEAQNILRGDKDSAYAILGIPENCQDTGKIKVAYRKMVMIHHPDKGGTEFEFKRVHAAYSWLMEKHED